MSTFVFIYRSPKDYTPSPEAIDQWTAWFDQLGDNVVNRGDRVVGRSTPGGAPADTVLGGDSLVGADDHDAAVALAKGCSIPEQSGGAEVSELAGLTDLN